MGTKDAIKVALGWMVYLDNQRAKSAELQRLAILAKTEPEEARYQMKHIDDHPVVYDAGQLEIAVTQLVIVANESLK